MTKKVLKGTVTSAKNNKTIVVEVTKNLTPLLQKKDKKVEKYHAHDEKNKFKEKKVSIIECKPIQKENLAGNGVMIQIQTN